MYNQDPRDKPSSKTINILLEGVDLSLNFSRLLNLCVSRRPRGELPCDSAAALSPVPPRLQHAVPSDGVGALSLASLFVISPPSRGIR